MPFVPPINIITGTSGTSLDIPNEWVDYFRAGDEVMVLDVSGLTADLVYIGNASSDDSAVVLGTNTCTVSAVGAEDSGAAGVGSVLITLTDDLNATPAGGTWGTGDILLLVGHSDTTAQCTTSFLNTQHFVIMEQGFNFKDPVDGLAAGNGGVLVESAVYSYTGRVDTNYLSYSHTYLNVGGDSSAAMAGQTYYTNNTRFNLVDIHWG